MALKLVSIVTAVKTFNQKSVSKVPLLGDIPLVGEYLFSSTSRTLEEDNLIVMLTPYIIDKSEKLSKLQKDLGVLAKLQKEYNLEMFKKIEKKSESDDVHESDKLDILKDDESGDF